MNFNLGGNMGNFSNSQNINIQGNYNFNSDEDDFEDDGDDDENEDDEENEGNENSDENNLFEIFIRKKSKFISELDEFQYKHLEKYCTFKEEKCPICLIEFYDDIISEDTQNLNLKEIDVYLSHELDTIKLFRCEDHFYHIECLLNYIQGKEGFKCAICQKIYGIIKGNMPNGRMVAKIDKGIRCKGYPNDETIVINYSFKDGYLNGQKYYGTYRTAYLPKNKEGIEILGMLKVAFDRKLTFVVGTSVTTGQKNVVVWNGIHHKTSTYGGTSNYGYPDPTYFNRVKEELAAKGILKDDFENGKIESIAMDLLYH